MSTRGSLFVMRGEQENTDINVNLNASAQRTVDYGWPLPSVLPPQQASFRSGALYLLQYARDLLQPHQSPLAASYPTPHSTSFPPPPPIPRHPTARHWDAYHAHVPLQTPRATQALGRLQARWQLRLVQGRSGWARQVAEDGYGGK